MIVKNNRAFTLIELLVVVLIIAILAAVALPQYQMAVLKSRYATTKSTAEALAQAEEIYYLANGEYTNSFDELDIDSPLRSVTNGQLCQLNKGGRLIQCGLYDKDRSPYMYYQVQLSHSSWRPGKRLCVAYATDLAEIRNKICKSDTGLAEPTGCDTGGCHWQY